MKNENEIKVWMNGKFSLDLLLLNETVNCLTEHDHGCRNRVVVMCVCVHACAHVIQEPCIVYSCSSNNKFFLDTCGHATKCLCLVDLIVDLYKNTNNILIYFVLRLTNHVRLCVFFLSRKWLPGSLTHHLYISMFALSFYAS